MSLFFLVTCYSKRHPAIQRPKQQRELFITMYQSGEGYKRNFMALDIPWYTVRTVIIKWRKYGATVTLPTGHQTQSEAMLLSSLAGSLDKVEGIRKSFKT